MTITACGARKTISDQNEAEMLRSGNARTEGSSVRQGFLPIALAPMPLGALANIAVYLRNAKAPHKENAFTLYCSDTVAFGERERQRLIESGVRFIYIPMHAHTQFRRQLESHLDTLVHDANVAISIKAEIVYETSVELIQEVLSEQNLAAALPRLDHICRGISALVVNDRAAFSHLFAASEHDFYTATHMVNVGTWMVPLAYAMGITDPKELNAACLAGLLHDMGKIYIPENVLNKTERLTAEDWALLWSHPQRGYDHLSTIPFLPEVVLRVVLEHHERQDGTGYPRKLLGHQMHILSRICAVIDSFDAMTAIRPFKQTTRSFGEALRILKAEAGTLYDAQVVEALANLLQCAERDGVLPETLGLEPQLRVGRRISERFAIECPARLHLVRFSNNDWTEDPAIPVVSHNISRSGIGLLCKADLPLTAYVRLYLQGQGTLANRVLEGQIIRTRKYQDGWHEIGIRFVPLADELKAAQATSATLDS